MFETTNQLLMQKIETKFKVVVNHVSYLFGGGLLDICRPWDFLGCVPKRGFPTGVVPKLILLLNWRRGRPHIPDPSTECAFYAF